MLDWSLLAHGFELRGTRVPLLSQQGIFKPKVLEEIPLSIRTSPSGPYDDRVSRDGLLLYRYRGTDPMHRDNVGLRKAMERHVPLIYFYRIVKGRYLAAWPVFIVGDDPDSLAFSVAVDDAVVVSRELEARLASEPEGAGDAESAVPATTRESEAEGRRAYITTTFQHRLHQRRFRERVLRAYREQCALCKLRHEELLDAAHIVPDRDPEGVSEVRNGLALCKLHHAAFNSYFFGIRPDGIVIVRPDVLEEEDGPMLIHGLKGLHETSLAVRPRRTADRPDPVLLERRWQRFRAAS